jgi:tetratricopeptide (TPR) repeat protein
LLPILIVLEGHALAAVSLNHGVRNRTYRPELALFETRPLTDVAALRPLVEGQAPDFLIVECTGFARSDALSRETDRPYPESVGREQGVLTFERALAAGLKQLEEPRRPFKFALDIAVAQFDWRVEPHALGAGRQSPPRGQTPVIGLPPDDVRDVFADRETERAEVRHLLEEGVAKFICIVGRGGVGKSALLSVVCADVEAGKLRLTASPEGRGADGIVYHSFRGDDHLTAERLFHSFAHVLGPPHDEELRECCRNAALTPVARARLLLAKLRFGRYLLALDNLDTALTADDSLADPELREFVNLALSTPHGLTLLATTRQEPALGQPGRTVRFVRLSAGLPTEHAAELLRAFDPGGEYGLRDGPPALLREAAQRCFGIPRALQSVAGILATEPDLTLESLLGQKELFSEQVVENLIAEHYYRLGPGQRRVLEALAVFDRQVPEEAVAHLLKPFFPDLDVRAALRRLVRSYFVTHRRGEGTYQLHPLDQQHAYCFIPPSGGDYTRAALHTRAADYFASLPVPEAPSDLPEVECRLLAYRHYRLAGDTERAAVVGAPLTRLLSRWGYYTESERILDEIIATAQGLPLASAHIGRASVLGIREWPQALEHFTRACAAVQNVPGGEALSLLVSAKAGIAYMYSRTGKFDEAIRLAEESLRLAEGLPDPTLKSKCLCQAALACCEMGEYERALAFCALAEEAAANLSAHAWGTTSAHISDLIGVVHYQRGHYAEARSRFEYSQRLRKQLNSKLGLGHSYENLGLVSLAEGRAEEALVMLEQSLVVRRQIAHTLGEIASLRGLGRVYLALSRFDQAADSFRDALDLSQRSAGTVVERVRCLLELGLFELAVRRPARAVDLLEEVRAEASRVSLQIEQVRCLRGLAKAYVSLGHEEKAATSAQEAGELSVRLGLPAAEPGGE